MCVVWVVGVCVHVVSVGVVCVYTCMCVRVCVRECCVCDVGVLCVGMCCVCM